jgi:hypothetical protein
MSADLKSLLVKLGNRDAAAVERTGRRLYHQIYITSARYGKHKTHDGEDIYFWPDRFDHAFYKKKSKASRRKEMIDNGRVERLRWIKEIVTGNVPHFECWLVDQTPRPENRLYIVSDELYVVWLEQRDAGGWKFSTAYPAPREAIEGYKTGGTKIK